MVHGLGVLLVAGLAAAAVLYLYDVVLTGPAWARVLGTVVAATAWSTLLAPDQSPGRLAALGVGAATVALLAVALLQLLQVQRDVALTTAFSRRR